MILKFIRKNHTTIQLVLGLVMTVLAPIVFAQDFNFAPAEEVSKGLNEGARGWWVTAASVMLYVAIFVAIICACIRALWGYLWVPFLIFFIAYFGGGSVSLMQDHIESSSSASGNG
jgi:hypothetical protein